MSAPINHIGTAGSVQVGATGMSATVLVVLMDDTKVEVTGITLETLGQWNKPGGAFASLLGTATELSLGVYQYEFDPSELDTVGQGMLRLNDGANAHLYMVEVLPYDPYASIYHADVNVDRDGDNALDEWSALWSKDGVDLTSGITSPTIQVIKRSDGTDLIASTAMTQIGSTGAYKYDTTSAGQRISAGESYIVVVTATIGGATRTRRRVIVRDV